MKLPQYIFRAYSESATGIYQLSNVDIKPFSDYNLLPIYVRVADDLRAKLGHPPFDYGAQLPGEIDLAKAYNLSRGTIRAALDILAKEGLISRQPGRGTLILSPDAKDKARYRIAVLWSIIRGQRTSRCSRHE